MASDFREQIIKILDNLIFERNEANEKVATLERQLSDLRAAQEGKWISVKERLPERRIRVLAWDGTLVKDCFYGKPSSVTRKHLSCAWRRTSDESLWSFVTHWQPLPPAPKEA